MVDLVHIFGVSVTPVNCKELNELSSIDNMIGYHTDSNAFISWCGQWNLKVNPSNMQKS